MTAWMAPGRSRVSTFIIVPDAMRVARFAENVFGATATRPPLYLRSGALWNYEFTIGDTTVMLGDGGDGMVRTAFLYVHVPDVDATFRKAVEAGARAVTEPENRFYGDRDGGVEDMAGNLWWIATHVEDLDPEEIARRAAAENRPA